MKVLLVNGSPHKSGCTNAALEIVAEVLREEGIEAEIFWIGTKPIGGCMGCGRCVELGRCVIDDVVNEFAEKAGEADGFVFGSPVHYAAMAGNLTCFMDRLFYSGKKTVSFALKPAAAVVSARRGGNTGTFDQINKYFAISEMPIVSSRYWNMVHGTAAEDVAKDEEGVATMRVLGRNMAYLLRCMEAARAAGVELPKQEPPARTCFIR